MNTMMIPCAFCGTEIGQSAYATDGTHVFHANCPSVVRYPRIYDVDEKPTGSDLRPDAMNLTMFNGMEITMMSLTEPSHCSGLNVMSMKFPF